MNYVPMCVSSFKQLLKYVNLKCCFLNMCGIWNKYLHCTTNPQILGNWLIFFGTCAYCADKFNWSIIQHNKQWSLKSTTYLLSINYLLTTNWAPIDFIWTKYLLPINYLFTTYQLPTCNLLLGSSSPLIIFSRNSSKLPGKQYCSRNGRRWLIKAFVSRLKKKKKKKKCFFTQAAHLSSVASTTYVV